MTPFRTVQQGDAVIPVFGHYISFPSLARDPLNNDIVLLYRKAVYDPDDDRPGMKAHGLDGSLYYKRFFPASKSFSEELLLVDGQDYPPGLIDGVLSTIHNRIHLVFRRYPNDTPVFYTSGESITKLQQPQPFPAAGSTFVRGAQWGEIAVSNHAGCLFQAYYGITPELYQTYQLEKPETIPLRPAVYRSDDNGQTWSFLVWISPLYLQPGVIANETALLFHQDNLYALMRTAGEYPGPLFMAYSQDEGRSWSAPEKTGLYGEAPTWTVLPDGRVLAGFRGYRAEDPALGGNFSIATFDPKSRHFSAPEVVETYTGNHYDGGYGDMLWLDELNQLMVVYYYSDTPDTRNPWIRYCLLEAGS